MKSNRPLWLILAGTAGLIILALAIFLTRQSLLVYGSEDTPQGVIKNYIVAGCRGDYQRAYHYFTTSGGRASLQEFAQAFPHTQAAYLRASIQLGETIYLENKAQIMITFTFGSSGGESNPAVLVREGGTWKIETPPFYLYYPDEQPD